MAGEKTQIQNTSYELRISYSEFVNKLESVRSENEWVYVRLYENDAITLEIQLAPRAGGNENRKGVLVIRGQKPTNKLVISSGLMLESLIRLAKAIENDSELRQKVKYAFEYLEVGSKKRSDKPNVHYI